MSRVLTALSIVMPSLLLAYQGAGADILGTVTDATGAAVMNASVSARNVSTNVTHSGYSNQRGFFVLPDLDPGVYDLRISAQALESELISGVVLTVGEDLRVNPHLNVGSARETIDVVGITPQVDVIGSATGGAVDERAITDLPLNGRDWTQLATLLPGVSTIGAQQVSGALRVQRGNGADLTISGGRPVENNYLLNGISINDYANAAPGSSLRLNLGVDAIQEFAVWTGSFPAEYGRSSGGVITAVTRSGANEMHGSLYYFHRNSALDARNFFDTSTSPPPFRRHQFGASLGGPIKRNKTFWFADYEGVQESLGQTETSLVPSSAVRQGIYVNNGSASAIVINPYIAPYLGIYPAPNRGLTSDPNVGIFAFAGQMVSKEEFLNSRVDHLFSDRDSVSGTFLYDDALVSEPDEFNNKPSTLPSRRYDGSVGETHIFGGSMVNSMHAGVSRSSAANGFYTSAYNPLLKDSSLGFVPGHDLGAIQVTGLSTFSGGIGRASGDIFNYTSYQLNDDLFVNRGTHSIKAGVYFENLRDDSDSADSADGTMTFSSILNFLQDKPFSFASLLPGSNTVRGIHQTIAAGYIQDDIQVRGNVTANLGVRYEAITQPAEEHGLLASLKHLTDSATTVGPYFNRNPTLLNFEPRIGLGWDPFGGGKTSVRGGFGIYDVLPLPYVIVNEAARATPFYEGGQASNLPAGKPLSAAYSLLTPSKLRTVYVQPNPSRSYKMEWNLSLQRDLGSNFVLSAGYVGSRGVHLPWRDNNMDTVVPALTSGGYVYPANGTVLNPHFGRIAGELFNADSYYHALQATVRKRFSRRVQGQVSYTVAKSIDTASGAFSSNEYSNTVGIPVPFDNRFNRGLSDFDQRHRATASIVWDLPNAPVTSGFFKWALQGWQAAGIFTASSGEPFSVGVAGDIAGSKMGSDAAQRPIPVSTPACSSAVNPGNASDYIKEECFIFPAPHVIGGIVGRNTLTGPGLADLDVSMFKNNHVSFLSDRANVQIRVEAYNAANHTNFAAPVSPNFQSPVIFDSNGHVIPSAGVLTATETPSREIQFGIKLIW